MLVSACVQTCVCVCCYYHVKSRVGPFFKVLTKTGVRFTLCHWPLWTLFMCTSVDMCMCLCVCVELWVHSNMHICLFMYTPECLCMSCGAFAIPCGCVCCVVCPSIPTSCCHLLLFPIINSAFAVTTNYSLLCPMTSDPPSLGPLHAKHRVKTEWPRLFAYFSSSCKWSHTFPQELPLIQHLACVLLRMLKWIWQIWASYTMVKETDNAIQTAAEELLGTLWKDVH